MTRKWIRDLNETVNCVSYAYTTKMLAPAFERKKYKEWVKNKVL